MSSELCVTSPDECLMEVPGLQHCAWPTSHCFFKKYVAALTEQQLFLIFGKSLANQTANEF